MIGKIRTKFWTSLLERSQGKTNLYSKIIPGSDYWLATSIGKFGISLNYLITDKYTGCELYLSKAKEDNSLVNQNKLRFDHLLNQKEQIEKEFGQTLDWQRLDNKWASRIAYHYPGLSLQNEDNWPEIQNVMIATMIRLDRAFRPFIDNLK